VMKSLLSIEIRTGYDTGLCHVVSPTTRDWLGGEGNRERLVGEFLWLSECCRDSRPPFGDNLFRIPDKSGK
jgi:hypothetical protein